MMYRKSVYAPLRLLLRVSLCETNIHECSGDISGYLKKTNGRTKMDSELAAESDCENDVRCSQRDRER